MAIMTISGKVSDMFSLSTENVDYDGYVPYDLGIGGGDYIRLRIEMDTGQIVDWDSLTEEDIKAAIDDE